MQIVGGYCQANIALEAGPVAIRALVQSTMLQLIDVGFYRIMLVLEPDKNRCGFFGLLPAGTAPFFSLPYT